MTGISLGVGLDSLPRPGGPGAPPVPQTHVFLLAGQSNMVGEAAIDGGPGYPAGTLQVARTGKFSGGTDGQLKPAADPLDHQDPTAGKMGLARQFCIDYQAAHPTATVVLIPAAHTATGFQDNRWNPGNDLYNDAVARVNALMAAQPTFLFKGVLWHQGEREVGVDDTSYRQLWTAMRAGFIAACPAITGATPWVVGEVIKVGNAVVNAALNDIGAGEPYAATAPAADLTGIVGNVVHFDAPSLRTLGSRYATALSVAASAAPAVPAKVPGLVATPGNGQVGLTWAKPAENHGPITDYRIERDGVAIAHAAQTATSFTDTGRSNGVAYAYSVSAINAAGTGAASDPASATPAASGHWDIAGSIVQDAPAAPATPTVTGSNVG